MTGTYVLNQTLYYIESLTTNRSRKAGVGRHLRKGFSDGSKMTEIGIVMPEDQTKKSFFLDLLNSEFYYMPFFEINRNGMLSDWSLEEDIGVDRITINLKDTDYLTVDSKAFKEGRIFVMEDFDTDADWTATPTFPVTSSGWGDQPETIVWTNYSGTVVTDTSIYYIGTQSLEIQSSGYVTFGSDWWSNYRISFFWQAAANADLYLFFRRSEPDVSDTDRHMYLTWDYSANTITLWKRVNGTNTALKREDLTITSGVWYKVDCYIYGNVIKLYQDDVLVFESVHNYYKAGRIGFLASGATAYVDNVVVTELIPNYVYTPYVTKEEIIDSQNIEGYTLNVNVNSLNTIPMYDNCVLWLDFNNIVGSHVPDLSKYKNHGTIVGGYEVAGKYNKGWALNDKDYIDIPDKDELGGWSEGTIIIRIKTTENIAAAGRRIISKWDGGGGVNWLVSQETLNDIRFGISAGVSFYPDTELTSLFDGNWHTLHFVFEQQMLWVYMDDILYGGYPKSTLVGNMSNRTQSVRIGYSGSYDGIDMSIDFTAIFNKSFHPKDFNNYGFKYYYYDQNSEADGFWDDLVFKFNANQGYGTTVINESKIGDSSTTQVADWANSSYNKFRKTLDYELSNNDYVEFADRVEYSFIGDMPFSVMADIKPETLSGYHTILSKYKTTGDQREWNFRIQSSYKMQFAIFDGTGDAIYTDGSTTLADGTDYHVAGTYDGEEAETGIEVYVNGENDTASQSESGTYAGAITGSAKLLMGNVESGGNDFDGFIDNVRLWRNRELTAAQIKWLYQNSPEIRNLSSATKFFSKRIIESGEAMLIDTGLVQVEIAKDRPLRTWFFDWNNNQWVYMGSPYFDDNTESIEASRVVGIEIEKLEQFYARIKVKLENYDITGSAGLLSAKGLELYATLEFFYGKKGYSITYSGSAHDLLDTQYHMWRFFNLGTAKSDFNTDFMYFGDQVMKIGEKDSYSEHTGEYFLAIDEYKNMMIGMTSDNYSQGAWSVTAALNQANYLGVNHSASKKGKFVVAYDIPDTTIIVQGSDANFGSGGVTGSSTDANASRGVTGYGLISSGSETYSAGDDPSTKCAVYADHGDIKSGHHVVGFRALDAETSGSGTLHWAVAGGGNYDKYFYDSASMVVNAAFAFTINDLTLDDETTYLNIIAMSGSAIISFAVDFFFTIPISNGINMIYDDLLSLLSKPEMFLRT